MPAKFNKFAELEGPIGRGNPGVARYDESRNWQDLASQDTHYLDFVSALILFPDRLNL